MRQDTIIPTTFNRSLSLLRVLAILAIVMGHFYLQGHDYMLSTAVSLCFVLSGYLTAMHHPFERYSIKEHLQFFGRRVAKIYPLHVLAVVLCVVILHRAINWKVVLVHLTMLQSFIPNADYYFGYNPVSWFVSTILFLFLMAPWLIRAIRLLPIRWQWVMLVTMLAVQFWGGYINIFDYYHLYQFPPMRLLDFAIGIAIYNLSQTDCFKKAQSQLSPFSATLFEIGAVLLFALFYVVGEKHLHPHCFRACCSSFVQVFIIITVMVFTHMRGGLVSKMAQCSPLKWFDSISMEIFLLQLPVYLFFTVLLSHIGSDPMCFTNLPLWAILLMHMSALLLAAWLAKRWFSSPIYHFYVKKIEPVFIGPKVH